MGFVDNKQHITRLSLKTAIDLVKPYVYIISYIYILYYKVIIVEGDWGLFLFHFSHISTLLFISYSAFN